MAQHGRYLVSSQAAIPEAVEPIGEPTEESRRLAMERMFRGDRDSRHRYARRAMDRGRTYVELVVHRLARWLQWRYRRMKDYRRADNVIQRRMLQGNGVQAMPPSKRRNVRGRKRVGRRKVKFLIRVAKLAKSTDPDVLWETALELRKKGMATKEQMAHLEAVVKQLREGE